MQKDTNISLIQLIKGGDLAVDLEISNLKAGRDINVYVRQYLDNSPDFEEIQEHMKKAGSDLTSASEGDKEFYADVLNNLRKIEKEFIVNALLLAKLFSEIEVRTERLKKAMQLFEQGKIREADEILKEVDLLNDQFNLIVFVEYREAKLKSLESEL